MRPSNGSGAEILLGVERASQWLIGHGGRRWAGLGRDGNGTGGTVVDVVRRSRRAATVRQKTALEPRRGPVPLLVDSPQFLVWGALGTG